MLGNKRTEREDIQGTSTDPIMMESPDYFPTNFGNINEAE